MNTLKLLLPILTAGFVAGMPSYALAKDACKDVKFEFKNDYDERIRVTKIKFYNSHANKTQTEVVKKKECAAGHTCKTGGDKLANADDAPINQIRAIYEEKEKDGSWSKPFMSSNWLNLAGQDRVCKDKKVYKLLIIPGPPKDGRA